MDKVQLHYSDLLPLMQQTLQSGKTVTISPKGTSMQPMLRSGQDTVILTAAPEKLKKYDIPFYRRENGEFVLHRIVKAGNSYTCIGDNQFVYESGVAHEQVIAVVCGFTRGGKSYTTDNLRYRLYCRLWHYTRPLRKLLKRLKGKKL